MLQRVVQLQPRGCLAFLTEFQRLVKLEHAQHAARVESAAPLPPEAANKVRARLAQAYGPGVNPSFVHNPALIGGIRITVGSDVFDGSVRGRLAALQRSF
jgi:F-type H+-transporting ATPase subunit delta